MFKILNFRAIYRIRPVRLKFGRLLSKKASNHDVNRIRNIGIIAHIDAGKTTTTERMLYYSGLTQAMGEVHDGDTVMDYMQQERSRGITITSAAITFYWKKHKINLIDTPGHVDFTFEVERSLRALDGAITILDASAGVEVQTLKVWDQATRYNVPCIIYLNKMDKCNADVNMCLKSLSEKLNVRPLLLHLPIGEGKSFTGVVDIITKLKVIWDKSESHNFQVEKLDIEKDADLWMSAMEKRELLIGNIADVDDVIADKFLSEGADSLSSTDLLSALRRITLNKSAVPVLCGSSYKNIGVQLLMDSVLMYLPNPNEKANDFVRHYKDNLCALVFKIIHNKNKEPLTFLRIYSGELKNAQKVYNVNRKVSEKIGKLMVAHADEFSEVDISSHGNIAVVTGLKSAVTGDVLLSSHIADTKEACVKENEGSDEVPAIIQVPDPVFFCSIEPPFAGAQKALEFALMCLQKEDPTFRVEVDEVGQIVISGMGELHIDIIKDRIRTEYGIKAYLGPLQVSYRETLTDVGSDTHILNKTISGSNHFVEISLKVYPSVSQFTDVKVIVTKENELGKVRSDHLKAINNGIKNAFNHGPILSFPVIDVAVDLLLLKVGRGTSLAMLSAASSQCVTNALQKANTCLLEPVMYLSIVVSKGYAGRVLNDLSQRKSQILGMELRQNVEVISAKTPLSELRGYSTVLRALSAGTCSLTLDFDNYARVSAEEQSKVIQDITGFAVSV